MAGGFTESAFIKKLADLNSSSQSIQTLSLWLIHHRKHYSTVVKIWNKELFKAKDAKKLTLMYLANDVIQNSRKKGPEYGNEFGSVLQKVFEHMSSCDEKIKNALDRLLSIWRERSIYDQVQIQLFKRQLVCIDPIEEPPAKKPKTEPTNKKPKRNAKERRKSETTEILEDGQVETHIQLSPHSPAGDPPEPEELIKAIQELEVNIASSDENVRERIAQLPREVSEVSLISKIEDKEQAQKLAVQVNDAVLLLSQYNTRLASEMEHRKKVAEMMRDFIHLQEDLLAQAEQNLEEYQEKLIKAYKVRSDLHAHIQNLPDLTQLPNVVDGLAPLPSAENLFMP